MLTVGKRELGQCIADLAVWHVVSGIGETAKGYGVIAHRFYGSDDGQIMVLDEWPDAGSFQTFFESTRDRIGPLMEAAGASSEPQVRFWRKLDTGDDIGWEG